jgi:hypothetical protein
MHLRDGEIVIRQCEVIHADIAIARLGQLLDRKREQSELRFVAGQIGVIDLALRLEHCGQMRVAVDREPVWSAGQHRVERARESGDRLLGQAVDQVDVDRAEALGSASVDHAQRLIDALHAVYGALHLGIEVLHAQARTVESHTRVLADVAARYAAWIELDREVALDAGTEPEMAGCGLQQRADIGRAHEVRSTAAQMDLDDLAIASEQRAEHRDFALQTLEIGACTRRVARDDAIAAAVEARAEAKGHVHVQRQSARNRPLVAVLDVFAKRGCGELRAEVRRSRIRGVARAGPVVATQRCGIELQCVAHAQQQTCSSAI